ncbi:DUF1684 domain-containing protein [bacterium]|nr:MAG: DUF1684 domain-containing protein [bacterium]
MYRYFVLFLGSVFIASCGKLPNHNLSTSESKKIEFLTKQNRAEKDNFFSSADSPLNDTVKVLFRGLNYYAFDSAYVFKLQLNKYEKPRELEMITSKGKIKHYTEYGYFEFDFHGRQKLNAYRPKPAIEGNDDYLFIPFKDSTNGNETYSAGRYIELTLHGKSDDYILDFNSAYNPWCAYSDNYNCPYPPKENHLLISVYAGEKKFDLKAH